MNRVLPWCAHRVFKFGHALGPWAGGLAVVFAVVLSCARPLAPPASEPVAQTPGHGMARPTSAEVPVGEQDVLWGDVNAPVTIVAFLDLECPFCSRVHPTVVELLHKYGREKVRLVVKHAPLPFHERGIPAAKAAQAVYRLKGVDVFWTYVGKLFEDVASGDAGALSERQLATSAEQVGVTNAELARESAVPEVAKKVTDDLELYQRLGGQGVPAFFINGAELTGARPSGDFQTLIEHELAAAEELQRRGVAASLVYERRVQANFRAPEAAEAEPPFEEIAYKVPVARSPVRGPSDAPVTIVEFADFECPFCARAHNTVEQLFAKYPGKLRWVMKHNPLPFHPVAIPAAITALEVRRQKGDDAYWRALTSFYAADALTPELLLAVADEHGLRAQPLLALFEADRVPAEMQEDQYLAMDLNAQGTPHFFINGRRLGGAQPLEVFEEIVQQELEKVSKLGVSGDVYAALQAEALPPPGLVRRDVPPPSDDTPVLGPSSAPVTIQMFADFECAYCQRVLPTLAALRAEFPGKIKLAWRHLPLAFHRQAKQAAAAAIEAKHQRGPDGFWIMAERLMRMPGIFLGGDATAISPAPPELPDLNVEFLRRQAKAMDLDEAKFVDALNRGIHHPAIAADEQLARKLGVNGTPAFFINGYALSGAQPYERFERLVRLALDEAKVAE